MTNAQSQTANPATWKFRREITLGALVQIVLVLAALAVGWSNLQSKLAVIQHDLTRLVETGRTTRANLNELNLKTQQHHYRLQRLEEKR